MWLLPYGSLILKHGWSWQHRYDLHRSSSQPLHASKIAHRWTPMCQEDRGLWCQGEVRIKILSHRCPSRPVGPNLPCVPSYHSAHVYVDCKYTNNLVQGKCGTYREAGEHIIHTRQDAWVIWLECSVGRNVLTQVTFHLKMIPETGWVKGAKGITHEHTEFPKLLKVALYSMESVYSTTLSTGYCCCWGTRITFLWNFVSPESEWS